MNKNITTLVPLTFPLNGSHLIEASAGTGKTFTIAMLYVRLILGHKQGESAFKLGELTPPQILVVTFTDAATKELRDRIRARLAEAARYFRADPKTMETPEDTDLLYELRREYAVDDWPVCARKLELAAEWMDEAAVSTIHGWCNRMLREHAFDSLSLFNQNLETDQSELLAEVIRDYWRNFYYPLGIEATALLRSYWDGPQALQKAIKDLLPFVDELGDEEDPLTLLEPLVSQLIPLKTPWKVWANELLEIFDAAYQAGEMRVNPKWYPGWFRGLDEWANNPGVWPEIGKAWEHLETDALTKKWNKSLPSHPGLVAFQTLAESLVNLEDPRNALLTHAACWVASEFAAAQKRRAQISFNDLLTSLDAALTGSDGERLAEVIRQQFPVALIDEFQDTDPVQYRIFERVYDIANHRDDCALILIGDPKQAIYAFRGADIYTYLKARETVCGPIYSLDKNFRSTQAMVDAANHCFAQVENKENSPGAFLFRKNGQNPVPFLQVGAKGRPDEFMVDDVSAPAITFAVAGAGAKLNKGEYLATMANLAATQIVDWLNRGLSNTAGFVRTGQALVPIRPGDLAVLVNDKNEAASIRQALSQRGVRSVYLSDKETVFGSAQATEVYRWMAACAEPDNDRLLRAALSTASLGLSFADLDAMNVNEEEWEARVIQFKGYREIWQKQGILPMLRRILFDFNCNDRFLSTALDANGDSGERILTDILHLAELLQQESFTLEGEHALIRFLAEQIEEPGGDAEGTKLRLESDADLVKVVTIHKSKGLEYPIVFLPFICTTRAVDAKSIPLKWHDEAGQLHVALEATDEILVAAEQDRLGEDLRKLYVALTRARYLTWVGLAPLKDKTKTAIGHLLGLSAVNETGYLAAVKSFAGDQAYLSVRDDLEANDEIYVVTTTINESGTACRSTRVVKENWWIGSYSTLPIAGHAPLPATQFEDTPQAENLLEGQREVSQRAPTGFRPGGPMHRFPKGAEAGTFLHDLMEWVANTGFSTVMENPAELRDMIARRSKLRGWEAWVDPLFVWVQQMLQTPLKIGEISLRLDSLEVAKAEMEFLFEARHVDLTRLDAFIVEHTLDRRPRPALTAVEFNGMLKGFMDLVFQSGERYYVADYKSNWLGMGDEDYTPDAMEDAICAHRYDLQYVIYLFALHRLLKSRLPEYDYDQHIGGAVYLFVRGIGAPSGGIHFERPPKALIESLETVFSGMVGGAA